MIKSLSLCCGMFGACLIALVSAPLFGLDMEEVRIADKGIRSFAVGELVVPERRKKVANGNLVVSRVSRVEMKYPLVQSDETVSPEGKVSSALFVADHFVVTFRNGTGDAAIRGQLGRSAFHVRDRIGNTQSYVISFPVTDADSMNTSMQTLKALPNVVAVERDTVVTVAATTPNDPQYDNLWGMKKISAPSAWDVNRGSASVVVAVIDTGVDYGHQDLSGNIWTNPGEKGLDAQGGDKRFNGVDDDGNGYIDDYRGYDFVANDNDPKDEHYHGTHCAGTVGGVGNNGVGVSGVCWSVSIVPLRVLNAQGMGYNSDIARAISYAAAMGAISIASNSYVGGPYDSTIDDAINRFCSRGGLFVAAAGNGLNGVGYNTDTSPSYPACYTNSRIISVAATDSFDRLTTFSNYGGSSVDIAAPGLNIYSTTPSNRYVYLSGTSMATPMVAGACALLKSANNSLNADQIKSAIMNYGDSICLLSGTLVSGRRLNINAAVRSVVPVGSPNPPGSFTGTIISANSVRFNWADLSSDESSFFISCTNVLPPYGSIGVSTSAGVTAATVAEFSMGGRYNCYIKSVNTAGSSSLVGPIVMDFSSSTAQLTITGSIVSGVNNGYGQKYSSVLVKSANLAAGLTSDIVGSDWVSVTPETIFSSGSAAHIFIGPIMPAGGG